MDLEVLSITFLEYKQSFYNCLEHELQKINHHEVFYSKTHISIDDEDR